ncbi:MAG: SDR family oxidoreductase [Bdellovibrionales bacterium]
MKTVLLTGANTGIGAAIYQRLKEKDSCRFVVLGRNKPDGMPFVETEHEWFVPTDLSNVEETEKNLRAVQEHPTFGDVDIIINNAGRGYFAKIEDIEPEAWSKVININLTAPYETIRTFLPNMKRKNYGRIINISSDADHIGFADAGVYCASKFGVLGLSEAIRPELVGKNITVTVISPGRVDTCFNNKKPGDRPLSLKPEDIALQVEHVLALRDNCTIETIRLKSTLE